MTQRLALWAFAIVLLPVPPWAAAYELTAVYSGEIRVNVSGGIAQGVRYLDNLDVQLEIDIADLTGPATGTLFLYGLYNNGSTLSDELVGDFQVVSNIEAPESWRIFELWYEFGGRPWSIRTGLYDLNSEFDVNHSGEIFHNSSHGIGAAFAQTSPSIFPVSALAIRTAYETKRSRGRSFGILGAYRISTPKRTTTPSTCSAGRKHGSTRTTLRKSWVALAVKQRHTGAPSMWTMTAWRYFLTSPEQLAVNSTPPSHRTLPTFVSS